MVISKIGSDVLLPVKNIFLNPPAADKYGTIKRELLSRLHAITEKQRRRKLFSGLHLGNRKPSFLLAEMQALNSDILDDRTVRMLWIDQLLENLHSSSSDGIMAIQSRPFDKETLLKDKIERIEQQISQLSKEPLFIRSFSCSRSRSKYRLRSRSQPCTSTIEDKGYSFYHRTFDKEAVTTIAEGAGTHRRLFFVAVTQDDVSSSTPVLINFVIPVLMIN